MQSIKIPFALFHRNEQADRVPVAQAYNLSHSGDRDLEDPHLKQAWANSLKDPNLKNTPKKKVLAEVVYCLPSKCEALNQTNK
jgi:hypothetical protein